MAKNEKAKLYVFAKKEVALIFIFMILIGVTSFVLGVRLGKNYAFQAAGFTEEDRQRVELLSKQEETVQDVVNNDSGEKVDKSKNIDATYKKLETEFERLDEDENREARPQKTGIPKKKALKVAATKVKVVAEVSPPAEKKDKLTGKYTVQLGSHQGIQDAEKFADGFKVRGYTPIINEVDIKGRGTWYRVSLGVFETVADAKEYIEKEKTLFKGTDYVIVQFD